jgi:DNA-binding LacI/PurR family transcriptional regulator
MVVSAMKPFRPLSAVEQLAGHLREEIRRGALSGEMPGANQIAVRLGCSARTVHAAVKQLERESLLQGQGAGRRSRIVLPEDFAPPALRVKILLYEGGDKGIDYLVELRHQLREAGHTAAFASRSLHDLGMDVKRVSRFVGGTEADAWIVVAASREILNWFAAQPVPAFALFGRQSQVAIAGTAPQKSHAMAAAVQRLAALGHSRIVCLTREERRKPEPGLIERIFLGELRKHGIAVGPYNIPDWEDNPNGLHDCLSSLFRTTPPTALICSGIGLFMATQQFLLQEGIRVPKDVSIICSDPIPGFAWSRPTLSHIDFDSDFWVRQIVRWMKGVAFGKDERRKNFNAARFVEGGTIGPAKS